MNIKKTIKIDDTENKNDFRKNSPMFFKSNKLKNERVKTGSINKKLNKEITDDIIDEIGEKLNINWKKFSRGQFKKGMYVEREHNDITHGDLLLTAKIVLAHLKEISTYYDELEKMEKKSENKKIEPKRKYSDSPIIKEYLDRINELSHNKK